MSLDTSQKLSSRKKSNIEIERKESEEIFNLKNLKKDYEELMKKYSNLIDVNKIEEKGNNNSKKSNVSKA